MTGFRSLNHVSLDWVVLVFGSIMTIAAVAYQPSFVDFTTSSDQLTIPSIWWDVVEGSLTNLDGWQFSRAPYLFPDLLVYGLAKTVLGDLRQAIFAACVLQLLAAVLVAGLVLNRLGGVRPLLGSRAMLGVLVALSCVALVNDWLFPDDRSFFRLLMYNYEFSSHYSSFVMALLGTVLVVDHCRGRRPVPLLVLAVLVTLMTISDYIFVLYFVLPMTLVVLGVALLRPELRKPALGVVAVHLLALTIGTVLLDGLNRQPLPVYKMHLSNFGNGVMAILHLVPPGELIFLSLFWLPLAILAGYGGWAMIHQARAGGRAGIAGFLCLAALVNLIFGALYIGREDDVLLRYLVMVTTAPLLVVALGLVRVCDRRDHRWLFGVVLVVPLAMYGVAAAADRNLIPTLVRWAPPDADDLQGCVTRYRLKAGLAGYYLARRLMAATDWAVQINQLNPERPTLYYWGNNLRWFDRDITRPGFAPEYNFVITNGFDYTRTGAFRFGLRDRYDDAAIEGAFGRPSAWVTCGALRVALFADSSGIDRAVNDLLVLNGRR